jgi:hypothetical protein
MLNTSSQTNVEPAKPAPLRATSRTFCRSFCAALFLGCLSLQAADYIWDTADGVQFASLQPTSLADGHVRATSCENSCGTAWALTLDSPALQADEPAEGCIGEQACLVSGASLADDDYSTLMDLLLGGFYQDAQRVTFNVGMLMDDQDRAFSFTPAVRTSSLSAMFGLLFAGFGWKLWRGYAPSGSAALELFGGGQRMFTIRKGQADPRF